MDYDYPEPDPWDPSKKHQLPLPDPLQPEPAHSAQLQPMQNQLQSPQALQPNTAQPIIGQPLPIQQTQAAPAQPTVNQPTPAQPVQLTQPVQPVQQYYTPVPQYQYAIPNDDGRNDSITSIVLSSICFFFAFVLFILFIAALMNDDENMCAGAVIGGFIASIPYLTMRIIGIVMGAKANGKYKACVAYYGDSAPQSRKNLKTAQLVMLLAPLFMPLAMILTIVIFAVSAMS